VAGGLLGVEAAACVDAGAHRGAGVVQETLGGGDRFGMASIGFGLGG
jgi:hypothetical protein